MKTTVYLLLICTIIVGLLLSSCKPGPETTSHETTTTAATETKTTTITQTTSALTPKYGGTITYALAAEPTYFDSGARSGGSAVGGTVYEQYLTLDWARGKAGSGVTDYSAGANFVEDHFGLALCESYEMPAVGVWVLQIRQGVHYQVTGTEAGRLMNGRQMTADDVVSSWNRLKADKRSWGNVSQPKVMNAASIEKTGAWEVTIKTPLEPWTSFTWVVYGAGFLRHYPPEVVAKYGDVQDWHNAVGTGPFILLDYVTGSSLKYKKNPEYWGTDPVGPGKGNKLPYVDNVKELIITDLSTRLSALRTGKVDFMTDIVLDDATGLITSNPEMEYLTYASNNPWVIGMRADQPGKPFSNVKVRQALILATDFESIKKDLFKNQAEIDMWPVNKSVGSLYQPLSEMPQNVQDLYKYNPDRAKQLMEEAGYPDGFKAQVICTTAAERIDELSVFKDMWAKIGIELQIEPKETAVYSSIANGRIQEDMIYRSMFQTFSIQLFLSGLRGTSTFNSSYVNDPVGSVPFIEDVYTKLQSNVFVKNQVAYDAYKSLKPFILEQAYYVPRPTPYTYIFWWPWLKNYYGQANTNTIAFGFLKYLWIDRDLKEQLGK